MLDRKWTLIVIGSAVLVYSIVVLCFILTTPDVGLRVLLSEAESPQQPLEGVRIHATPHMDAKGTTIPQVGDRLVRLGDLKTYTFLDFASQIIHLRKAKPASGVLTSEADPSELAEAFGLPTLVEVSGSGVWIEAEFLRPQAAQQRAEPFTAWLQVQSLPLSEVFLSFIWFSMQLGFFLLSALLCWNRPFDRAARMLFGLGIVALGAFIAGNHWWVMAANLWLIVPCATCGILLPAVLLHFFLVFPRPKLFLQQHRVLSMLGVYLVPSLAVAATMLVVSLTSRIHTPGEAADVAELLPILDGLRYGIYGYFCVAAVYFLLSLYVLWQSLQQSQQAKERQQLRWIWHGATLASVFIAVTLVLGLPQPGGFCLGQRADSPVLRGRFVYRRVFRGDGPASFDAGRSNHQPEHAVLRREPGADGHHQPDDRFQHSRATVVQSHIIDATGPDGGGGAHAVCDSAVMAAGCIPANDRPAVFPRPLPLGQSPPADSAFRGEARRSPGRRPTVFEFLPGCAGRGPRGAVSSLGLAMSRSN